MVSIDATHVRATTAWPGGFFASYHAYPYYPDFLRRDPGLPPDAATPTPPTCTSSARYHHGQAVMITEFGVPTGIGVAHRGPLGRDQGDHTEAEAGAMDGDMLRDIKREGYAGGHALRVDGRVVQVHLEHVRHEQPGDRRAAVAQRPDQRGAVRR